MKCFFTLLIVAVFFSCKSESNEETIIESTYLDSIEVEPIEVEPVSIVDSAKILQLKNYFNYRTDEFEGVTWVIPKTAPKYANRNAVYTYFQINNNIPSNLRFKLQFTNDDWIFMDNCIFLIDNIKYVYTPEDVKRDNDAGDIWEWFDESVNYKSNEILNALSVAKSAKVKINGDKYFKEVYIKPKEILSIKRTIDLYKAMGGN